MTKKSNRLLKESEILFNTNMARNIGDFKNRQINTLDFPVIKCMLERKFSREKN